MRRALFAGILALIPVLPMAQTDDEIAAARAAYEAGEFDAALAVLEPAARGGDPVGQYILGLAYDSGQGKPAEPRLAAEWTRKSAEAGLDSAQYLMGLMHLDGREGLDSDPVKAAEWFEKAMKQGHPQAFFMRAGMMRDGVPGPADPAGAAALFGVALEMGAPQAGVALGDIYRQGLGVPKDEARARDLFARAAGMGYGAAMGNLALMHEMGMGGPKDMMAAYALYQEAVALGDANAAVNLAWFMVQQPGYWQNNPLAYAYCIWAERIAPPEQAEGFAATCGQVRDILTENEIEQAQELAAAF